MQSYRLEEKIKTLINHHFDIWLYKSPEYTVIKCSYEALATVTPYRIALTDA